jgi:hypothetical protein
MPPLPRRNGCGPGSTPTPPAEGPANVYVCDRFIIPCAHTQPAKRHRNGNLLLDQLTKTYIRRNLTHRFTIYPSGQQAFTAEQQARAGASPSDGPT